MWKEVVDPFNKEQLSVISLTNCFNRIRTTIEELLGTTW